MLGNLSDFTNDDIVASWDDLEPVDKYMMARAYSLLIACEEAYDAYKFQSVYRTCYDFVNELSSVYMDVAKDRLYSESPNSPRRRAVQTVLMNTLEVLVRVLSPIISFTCDEVWENYPEGIRMGGENRPFSVQLAGWPMRDDFAPALPGDDGAADIAAFEAALEIREAVTKSLEDARAAKEINKSQEAAVSVTVPQDLLDTVADFEPSVFEELFIVSGVNLVAGDDLSCTVEKATGDKCPRCWNYRELGGNASHPDVCKRCGDALDEIGFVEA